MDDNNKILAVQKKSDFFLQIMYEPELFITLKYDQIWPFFHNWWIGSVCTPQKSKQAKESNVCKANKKDGILFSKYISMYKV